MSARTQPRAPGATAPRLLDRIGDVLPAPLLLATLYGAAFALAARYGGFENDTLLALFAKVFGGIATLFVPLIVYSSIDVRLTRAALHRAAREWCAARGAELLDAEQHKNHFALRYVEGGTKRRRKFRLHFAFFTWRVRHVEWLDSES